MTYRLEYQYDAGCPRRFAYFDDVTKAMNFVYLTDDICERCEKVCKDTEQRMSAELVCHDTDSLIGTLTYADGFVEYSPV